MINALELISYFRSDCLSQTNNASSMRNFRLVYMFKCLPLL